MNTAETIGIVKKKKSNYKVPIKKVPQINNGIMKNAGMLKQNYQSYSRNIRN